MAVTVDEVDGQLDFRKIPVVDLRYLSQDEINCAAQCSDEYSHVRFDDIVIPKIDRSIFNESAGSRKQTYSRLRFSQRNREQQQGNVSRRRAGLLSLSRHSNGGGMSPIMRQNTNPNPSDENGCEPKDNNNDDNGQIMMLLKKLFMKGEPEASSICASAGDQTLEDVLSPGVSDLPALNSTSASNGSSNNSAHDIDQNTKCEEERGDVLALKVEDCSQLAESNQEIVVGVSGERLSANVVANEKVVANVCDAPVIPLLSITNEDIEMKNFENVVIPNAGGSLAFIKNMPITNEVANDKVKTNSYNEIVIPVQSTKNERLEMEVSDGDVIPTAGGLRSLIKDIPIPNGMDDKNVEMNVCDTTLFPLQLSTNENAEHKIFDGPVIRHAVELSASMQNMPISNVLGNEKMESNVCHGAAIPVQLTMNDMEEIKICNGAVISNVVGLSAGFQDIPISNGVANEKTEINICNDTMIPMQSTTNGKLEMEISDCVVISNAADHFTMDKEAESNISVTTAVPNAAVQSTMYDKEAICVPSVSMSLEMNKSNIIVDENLDRPKKKLRTKENARRKGQAIAAAHEQQNVLKMLGVSQDFVTEDSGCFDTETTTEVQDTKIAYDANLIHKMSAGNMLDTTLNNNNQRDLNLADKNNAIIQVSPVAAESGCSSTEQFVPQLKRKFQPFETEDELQDFFEKVGGNWASQRKKRKIVDAEEFCEGFPKGWKLLLGVRKKESRFLIECRKYISPDGQHLASCREVSAYIRSTSQPPSCGSAEHAQKYLKLTSSKPCISMGPADFSEGNHKDLTVLQNDFVFLQEEMQTSKRKTSTSRMAEQNSRKDHDTRMKCSKCNVEFSNRSTFMGHLAVHHNSNNKTCQKEKKTSAGKSLADGVIIVDGKYECQICHKVFNERHRYTGHVGIHVRNAKKPQASLDGISNQAAKGVSTLNDIGSDKSAVDTNHNAVVTSFSENYNQQEQNANLFYGVLPDSSSPSVENKLTSSYDGHLASAFDPPSTKDEPDYGSENLKIDNLSGFEQFHMAYQPKFSFETGQDTNNAIDAQMELGLDSSVLHQEMDPPDQFEWESILARIENSSQHFVCVWCNSEFNHDGIDGELQTGSLGFMCPVCKSKISGQVNM